jgi:tetratricopeptide (TPR) repeat protein
VYLRTPKRYQKQRRHLISLKWAWLWLLTPLVALGGYYLYENRDQFAPPVQTAIESVMSDAQRGMATMTAPTPLPTANPDEALVSAGAAWQQGAIDEAVDAYRTLLPNAPNNLTAHYRTTFGLVMQGRSGEAVEYAEMTVNANPFAADAWAVRAFALNTAGRQGEAIASAMQALQFDPESARATAFLAEAYFDSNQPQRALETVERALELDPDSFEALYVFGRINQESTFDFQAALDAYERAYEIAPNMPYIGVSMAWLQFYLQEGDAGFELLQSINELNPVNTNALYALSFFSYSLYGDPNQALDYLTRCTAADPNNIACTYYNGTVLFGLGENERAAESFMRVIEIGTDNPRHYLSAGRINAALNNCAAAIPLLQTGYDLARSQPLPDENQLAEFESALQGCGARITPRFSDPEATEAPPVDEVDLVEVNPPSS